MKSFFQFLATNFSQVSTFPDGTEHEIVAQSKCLLIARVSYFGSIYRAKRFPHDAGIISGNRPQVYQEALDWLTETDRELNQLMMGDGKLPDCVAECHGIACNRLVDKFGPGII